jgi:hypothetical protein
MTPSLEKAIALARELPEADQNLIAQMVLDMLEDEAYWDEQFASSQAALEQLADEALADLRAGRIEPLDLDRL